jgi:hypothetical protein
MLLTAALQCLEITTNLLEKQDPSHHPSLLSACRPNGGGVNPLWYSSFDVDQTDQVGLLAVAVDVPTLWCLPSTLNSKLKLRSVVRTYLD